MGSRGGVVKFVSTITHRVIRQAHFYFNDKTILSYCKKDKNLKSYSVQNNEPAIDKILYAI